jgi:hypothetical protein
MSYNYKRNLPPEKRCTSSLRIVIPLKETITEIISKDLQRLQVSKGEYSSSSFSYVTDQLVEIICLLNITCMF